MEYFLILSIILITFAGLTIFSALKCSSYREMAWNNALNEKNSKNKRKQIRITATGRKKKVRYLNSTK